MATFQRELAPSPYSWLLARTAKPTPEISEQFCPVIRVSEAARLLGCGTPHLRRLIALGVIRSTRYGKKGYHRIPVSEITRLAGLKKENQK
jgi:excisionase family DNA binding protein